jgi:rhamnogalacturonyl hydrolase YesR
VGDWQLANRSKIHEPTFWTEGAMYTGIMALSQISSSPRFHDAMVKMGEGNKWQLGPRPYHADDHCVAQTYAELYAKDHKPEMIAAAVKRFDYILAHPKDDDLNFDRAKHPDRNDRWAWCDALFMAPAAWLRVAAVTGKKEYVDFAVTNWWKTSAYLYDPKAHLYYRDSTYFDKQEANGEKVFWSRGNGWVIGGLARVIPYLPKDHPDRPRFIQQFKEMCASILVHQQSDGLWRSSLLDPASYPLKETSGSGFFCFGFAWGVNQGFLDRATYEPAARKAWAALVSCVNSDGKLTHVQPVGADPKKFDADATESYGVGAFLLAGREIYAMDGGK